MESKESTFSEVLDDNVHSLLSCVGAGYDESEMKGIFRHNILSAHEREVAKAVREELMRWDAFLAIPPVDEELKERIKELER